MSNDTTIYVGAYAIVQVPQRTIEKSKRRCSRSRIHNVALLDDWVYFCPQCGARVDSEPYSITVATTLDHLVDDGKLEEDKYHSIPYSINHVDVDEPFIGEPLILTSNHDDGTALARIDPDEGDCYPWDVIIANISPDDITKCTSNFIRLYFEELKMIGKTTVHFGILKEMEL